MDFFRFTSCQHHCSAKQRETTTGGRTASPRPCQSLLGRQSRRDTGPPPQSGSDVEKMAVAPLLWWQRRAEAREGREGGTREVAPRTRLNPGPPARPKGILTTTSFSFHLPAPSLPSAASSAVFTFPFYQTFLFCI